MTSRCIDAVVLAPRPSSSGTALFHGRAVPPDERATRDAPDRDGVRRSRQRGSVLSLSSSSSASVLVESRRTSSFGSESKDGKGDENDNNKKEEGEGGKRDDSNIFLDNLGKIFLSTIGIVLLSLLRSTKSNNSRAALREDVETAALLDPLEIDDLRLANQDFTITVWETIVGELRRTFPQRRSVTYPEFLTVVTRVMRYVGGEGFTVQFGHSIDRVVIAELERIAAEGVETDDAEAKEEAGGDDEGGGRIDDGNRGPTSGVLPLPFLLAALSLALHGTVSDRVRALYESASIFDDDGGLGTDMDGGEGEGSDASTSAATLSGGAASRMVQYLQRTCQLVPEAQIVETNSSVPYRTFRVGSGDELVRRARGGYGGKKGTAGVTREAEGRVTLEEFHAILRSRTVCAWGECYVKKTGETATSDR
jgi:hypothetical protein